MYSTDNLPRRGQNFLVLAIDLNSLAHCVSVLRNSQHFMTLVTKRCSSILFCYHLCAEKTASLTNEILQNLVTGHSCCCQRILPRAAQLMCRVRRGVCSELVERQGQRVEMEAGLPNWTRQGAGMFVGDRPHYYYCVAHIVPFFTWGHQNCQDNPYKERKFIQRSTAKPSGVVLL